MTVGAMLKGKGRGVITGKPEMAIMAVCQLLQQHNIGAVVLTDAADRIVGIVSERDVIRTIAGEGPDILKKPVSAIMVANVVTSGVDETVDEVMMKMTMGRFRHLPIAEDGRLIGLISIGDVVKAKLEAIRHETEAMRAYITTA